MSVPYSDPNDRFSYEQWMNDLGAQDENQRSRQAFFQDRCDCCRRFVNPSAIGVSWSQQWSYDMDGTPDLHDVTYRCSPCTDKHGIKPTNCNESNGSKYHGRNQPKDPTNEQ